LAILTVGGNSAVEKSPWCFLAGSCGAFTHDPGTTPNRQGSSSYFVKRASVCEYTCKCVDEAVAGTATAKPCLPRNPSILLRACPERIEVTGLLRDFILLILAFPCVLLRLRSGRRLWQILESSIPRILCGIFLLLHRKRGPRRSLY